jgi:hypothetical protein
MKRIRRISALALALATLAVGYPAGAAGTGFRFAWTAPPGCPERAAVLDRVAELVGSMPRAEDDLWFEADVTSLEGGRWRVVLRSGWPGSTAERRFESASCASIASATAFIISMSLDPAGVAERATRAVSTSRERDEDARAERAPMSPPLAKEAAVHLAFGPRTTGDVGSLPKASLGAGAAISLWQAWWLVAASGQAWLPRQTAGNVYGAGGEIGLLTGELRGCAAIATSGARIDVCAGAEAGTSDGMGTGLAHPLRARGLWLAALGGLVLRPAASGLLGAWIGVDAGVPLAIPTYVIDGIGEVHRPWPVFARASMGVEFRAF